MKRWIVRIIMCLALGACATFGMQVIPVRAINASSRVALPITSESVMVRDSERSGDPWAVRMNRNLLAERYQFHLTTYTKAPAPLTDDQRVALRRLSPWIPRLAIEDDNRLCYHAVIQSGFPFRALFGTASVVYESAPIDASERTKTWTPQNFQSPIEKYVIERGIAQVEMPILGHHTFVFTPIWRGLVLNSLLYALMMLGILAAARRLVYVKHTDAGKCPQCAYDIRHLQSTGCPECGWNRAPSELIRAER